MLSAQSSSLAICLELMKDGTQQPRLPALFGRRVIDLTRVLAGPWCTMVLADLGADVIKIEHPNGGDDTRHWGPPYIGGEAAYYICANRNKRSVTVNLGTRDGQQIVRDLAVSADIMVENYKLGGLTQYGLDYDAIAALNPAIVYCSISGYGRNSPIADRPGYDYVIQAEAGLMDVTGEVDGEPMKAGVAVSDLFTGMAATQAILAALLARDRDGVGQHIDLALFDCQLSMMANVGSSFLANGEKPRRYGNGHATVVPYQVFKTSDGSVVIAVGNDRQFAMLCDAVLKRPEMALDPRYAKNSSRVVNRNSLISTLRPLIEALPTTHWLRGMRDNGIPCAEVRSIGEALLSEEAVARDMVRHAAHPTAGIISMIGSPLKLSGTPVVSPVAPPLLGQHTVEVLTELLGYDSECIERLRLASVI
jgi:crotonobetainyl-CoA:carnitine CoA-transferase CaiB-like acyl-CoA transferase